MNKKSYYDVLGVSKTATQEEITKAYRSLVKKHHPDRFEDAKKKEAEDRFKEISEAYTVLKDQNKRTQYDHGGDEFGGFDSSQFQQGSSFFNGMDDIFSSFFGGGQKQSTNQAGRDLSFDLEITLEQAYHGHQTKVKIPKLAKCEKCKGVGSMEPPVKCNQCQGKGTLHVRHGFFHVEQACSNCNGTGKTIKVKCRFCAGNGRVKKDKEISITIPQGIENGQEIRLVGEGDEGVSRSGDLYIRIRIAKHKEFTRVKSDLYCSVNISPVQAVNSSEIQISSIDKKMINIKIPEGIQSETKLRVATHGMVIGRSKGNLYVRVVVQTPSKKTMTAEEINLWSALDKISNQSNKTETKTSSFENIKNMFNKWTS
ncbi:molecular chaperone DnaJ [Candidatus Cytomitobacter primus]|uniref:Chaperone protein DnaJ n=1 Tax=Candidatus Cytomitobacter primus TaxID=2066024 RepID=A0A5C0UFR5_9PROT|nr:molecular chaperone DnaJ [Candidatus Cytomitobacter primus]QEK38639.1 molecular chaperone DnaJ [Candidatus Cytomitobacter primus]